MDHLLSTEKEKVPGTASWADLNLKEQVGLAADGHPVRLPGGNPWDAPGRREDP